jgi:glucokinase
LRAVGVLSAKVIYEHAQAGDRFALDLFDYTARILATKLADAVTFSSPEAIILFGGLAQSGDLLLKPLKAYLETYLMPIFRNKVQILPSQIQGSNAAVLGASALVPSV